MKLPGPGDGQDAGPQGNLLLFDGIDVAPRLLEGQFEAFLAMPGKSPILLLLGVPQADRLQARQALVRQARAGILAAREGMKLEFARPRGGRQRPAGVGRKGLAGFLVNRMSHRGALPNIPRRLCAV